MAWSSNPAPTTQRYGTGWYVTPPTKPPLPTGWRAVIVHLVAQSFPAVVSVSLTGNGNTGAFGQSAQSITVGLTADGVLGTVGQATTVATVAPSAAGAVNVGSATTALTIGLTAAGILGLTGGTTPAIIVVLTADGIIVPPAQPSLPTGITVGLTAAGVVAISSMSTATTVSVSVTAAGTAIGAIGPGLPYDIPFDLIPGVDVTVTLTAAGRVGTVGQAPTAIAMGLTAGADTGVNLPYFLPFTLS